jgi:hypothetical protein
MLGVSFNKKYYLIISLNFVIVYVDLLKQAARRRFRTWVTLTVYELHLLFMLA